MPKGYKLTADALRELGNLIRRNRGPAAGRRARSGFARREAKIVRTGTVFSTITAATAAKPGFGYVTLDKIRTDDETFREAEALPEPVYNLSTTTFLFGTRVRLGRDQTAFEMDAGARRQRAVWVVGDYVSDAFLHEPCELCMTDAQTVTVDAKTNLKFQTVKNLNTAYYGVGDQDGGDPLEATQITLLKQGWYELGYAIDWAGPITSSGDGTGNSDDIVFSHGTLFLEEAGVGTIACTTTPHVMIHHNNTGDSLGGSNARQILFRRGVASASIRLATQNGSATHNRTFGGVFWANYLGHDKDPSTSIVDEG